VLRSNSVTGLKVRSKYCECYRKLSEWTPAPNLTGLKTFLMRSATIHSWRVRSVKSDFYKSFHPIKSNWSFLSPYFSCTRAKIWWQFIREFLNICWQTSKQTKAKHNVLATGSNIWWRRHGRATRDGKAFVVVESDRHCRNNYELYAWNHLDWLL